MARTYSHVAEPHRELFVDEHRGYQRGDDVRALQAAANRRLRARGLDRYVCTEDGEYGPQTALACRKSSWVLGALVATVESADLSIGEQRMIRYPGTRVRAQLERAKARVATLAKPAPKSSRGVAIHEAGRYVGITEQPAGSNGGPHITDWQREFGFGHVAWCGIFAGHCLKTAGVQGVSARIASVWFIEVDAKNHRGPFRGWVGSGARGVMRGDLAVIGGPGVHVEVVVKAYPDGSADTIGGNTSFGPGGSQSNGGCVARRHRTAAEVYGFALVDYPG